MARQVSVDINKIRHASVVPFEEDQGLFGISWDGDGISGSDLIGTKKEAEAEMLRIRRDRRRLRLVGEIQPLNMSWNLRLSKGNFSSSTWRKDRSPKSRLPYKRP